MGDHHNPRAQHHAARPAMPMKRLGINFDCAFALKENVKVLPADCIRENAGGAMQIKVKESADAEPTWIAVPEGVTILTAGVRYEMEHLDFVVALLGTHEDTTIITGPGGRPSVKAIPLVELFREDAKTVLAKFNPPPPPADAPINGG